jgi:GT2 family glycosyltransferase
VSELPPPRVSAVVLHHRDPALLDVILGSLSAQRYRDFETIVVDDASSDGSAIHLREHWPQVRVIRTGEHNVGVAGALNVGVGAASGELIALLNNDLELDPNWIGELVATLDRNPQAGSAACKLRNFYRRGELDGAGDVFTRAGGGAKRGNGEPDRGQYDAADEVLAPTGGAGLYRRRALVEAGPFDESLFAYFEDVDWGLRAQGLGYRCVYNPAAVGYHMEGRTTGGKANPTYYALQSRNLIGVLVKNVPTGWIVSHIPWIVAHQLGGLVRSTRARLLGAHLHGLRLALGSLPRWMRVRREIAGSRRLSAREFSRALAVGSPKP